MTTYGDAFSQAVAAELRAERGRRQMTLAALVQASGLSKSGLLNYLNGARDIPVPALVDLCAALGVDPRVIFERAQDSLK